MSSELCLAGKYEPKKELKLFKKSPEILLNTWCFNDRVTASQAFQLFLDLLNFLFGKDTSSTDHGASAQVLSAKEIS